MLEYERPQVELLEFISSQSIASENINEPSLVNDSDGISIGEVPGFTEGVGDW